MSEASRVAVITGGTRGLGRALSLSAARAGIDVIAIYHSNEEAAQALLKDAEGLSGSIKCVRHDLADPGFPEIPQGKTCVFIHAAAAPFRPSSLHLLKDFDFQKQWEIAVLGFLNGLRAVLRPMVRTGGGTVVIVLTTALEGAPPKGFGAYAAAKAALRELGLSVGCEYRHQGIRTICTSPGFMATTFSASWGERFGVAACESQGGLPLDPAAVATRIWSLIEDASLPACGENYQIIN